MMGTLGTLFISLFLTVAEASELKLGLDDCISIAVNNSTASANARLDSELTAIQLLQSYGQFLPNLAVSMTVNEQAGGTYITGTTPTRVSTENYGGGLQLISSINLFNGFSDTLGLKAATERHNAGRLSLSWAMGQIALDVSQAFFQATLSRELLRIAKDNFEISQVQQEAIKNQVSIGVRTIMDLRRQEAQTGLDEVAYANAQNRARQDLISLLKRLRINPSNAVDLVYSTQVTKKFDFVSKESDLVSQALRSRADLKAAKQVKEAFTFDLKAARASILPRVDFAISLADSARIFNRQTVEGANAVPSEQRSIMDQLGTQANYSLGVSLTWNLFDRNLTRANEARAQLAIRKSQLAEDDIVATIVSDIQRTYSDLSTANIQIKVTERALQAARSAFDMVKEKYLLGKGNFNDVLVAQSSRLQIETARSQAIFSYQLHERAMSTIVGDVKGIPED